MTFAIVSSYCTAVHSSTSTVLDVSHSSSRSKPPTGLSHEQLRQTATTGGTDQLSEFTLHAHMLPVLNFLNKGFKDTTDKPSTVGE